MVIGAVVGEHYWILVNGEWVIGMFDTQLVKPKEIFLLIASSSCIEIKDVEKMIHIPSPENVVLPNNRLQQTAVTPFGNMGQLTI